MSQLTGADQPVPTPVERLINAANQGDSDAFVAAFGSDGVVDDWCREFRGPAAIRGWSDQEFIGVNVSLTVLDTTIGGSTVTVTAQVGGNGYTGPSHFRFSLRGDRVARMAITA